jgi:hypothetical protein
VTIDPTSILIALFSAGGVAFLTACYRAFRDWREGTWKRRDSAVADLEKWRRDADDAREWEALQHQWWRGRAGRLEYVILTNLGQDALPEKEPYPTRPVSEHE